jgi:hypothetical protein
MTACQRRFITSHAIGVVILKRLRDIILIEGP